MRPETAKKNDNMHPRRQQIRSSQRRAKNMSNRFDELIGHQGQQHDGNLSNEGGTKISSPSKQSALFFGGNAASAMNSKFGDGDSKQGVLKGLASASKTSSYPADAN